MKPILNILGYCCIVLCASVSQAQIQPAVTTTLSPFTSLVAGGPIDVRVKLNQQERIRFEGDKAAIATLVVEVRGASLIIRPQMSWSSWKQKYRGKKIIAVVSAKRLNSLTQSGDGALVIEDEVSQEGISITKSGSGNMQLKVDVDKLTLVMSGSGALELDGQATSMNLTLSGSGTLSKNSAFEVGQLKAIMNGSGSAYLTCNGEISATIGGSATIHNKGSANVNQKVILGTGGVIQN